MKRVEIARDAVFTVYRNELENEGAVARLVEWLEHAEEPEEPFDLWADRYLEHLRRWLLDLGSPDEPEPLSASWWIGSLIKLTEAARSADEANHKLHLALALGERREAFKFHFAYLESVERAQKDRLVRAAGGAATRKHDHAAMALRAEALKVAHPSWRRGSVIAQISKETGIPKSSVRDALKSVSFSDGR